MISTAELERIIAFAVPIESKDCKRVVAKKEWRREELKKMIDELIDKEAAFKLAAIVVAASVKAERERAKPVPDFALGGVVDTTSVAILGNDDRSEYIIPPDELLRMEAAAGCHDTPPHIVEQFEALRKSRWKDDQAAKESKI